MLKGAWLDLHCHGGWCVARGCCARALLSDFPCAMLGFGLAGTKGGDEESQRGSAAPWLSAHVLARGPQASLLPS